MADAPEGNGLPCLFGDWANVPSKSTAKPYALHRILCVEFRYWPQRNRTMLKPSAVVPSSAIMPYS